MPNHPSVDTYLLLLSLCSSSSGDTYCAVPTNVLVGSPTGIVWSETAEITERKQHPPPVSRSLPVPKSVIFIRRASSSRMFSGFKSLAGGRKLSRSTEAPEHGTGRKDSPVNDSLRVHVPQSIDDLRSVVAHAGDGERAQPRYPRLELPVACEVEDEDWRRIQSARRRAPGAGTGIRCSQRLHSS